MPARELRAYLSRGPPYDVVGPTAIFFSPVEFRALLHRREFSRSMVVAQMWRTGEHVAPKTAEDGSRIRRLSETFNKAGDFEVEPNSLVAPSRRSARSYLQPYSSRKVKRPE
jgi:hypothetical protein